METMATIIIGPILRRQSCNFKISHCNYSETYADEDKRKESHGSVSLLACNPPCELLKSPVLTAENHTRLGKAARVTEVLRTSVPAACV